jgi:cytochrome b involved in lipid metabolism
MTTRRFVLAAVFVFLASWGILTIFALQKMRDHVPPGDAQHAHSSDVDPSPPMRFSLDEIARHDQPADCWLLIGGRVYDVTSYIASHPAPRRTITDYCGGESTEAFETKERGRPHSSRAKQLLETYFIGNVAD